MYFYFKLKRVFRRTGRDSSHGYTEHSHGHEYILYLERWRSTKSNFFKQKRGLKISAEVKFSNGNQPPDGGPRLKRHTTMLFTSPFYFIVRNSTVPQGKSSINNDV